jgi:hypothetical protein
VTTRVGALGVVEKAAGTTSINLTLPAGAAVGDVAVAGGGCNIATIMGAQTGWTTVLSKSSTADTLAPNGILCIRTIDATDVSNGFVTLNNVTSAVGNFGGVLLRGVTTTQDFTAVYLDKTGTVNGNFDFPTQTTTQPGVTLVYMVSQATVASATMTPPSAPATFTEDAERVTGRNMTMGDLIWGSSGATGTMTVVSGASTRGIGLMVALRSAVSTDPTPVARRVNRPSFRRQMVSRGNFRGVNSTEIPPRQIAPPMRANRRPLRRLAPRTAGNFVAPPPAQAPAPPAFIPDRARPRRGLFGRRPRRTETVVAQTVVPPPPILVPGVQGRDKVLKGWLSRRSRVSAPLSSPDGPTRLQPHRLRVLWRRRPTRADVVAPQETPPQRTGHAARLPSQRRARRVETVPTPAPVVAPAYVPSASQRRTLRGLLARKARRVEVVPPQVVVAPPVLVPSATQRRALRGMLPRRGRRPEVVPPQTTPTPPTPTPRVTARRTVRGIQLRRSHRTEPPQEQAGLAPSTKRTPRRLTRLRRSSIPQPVPAQAAVPVAPRLVPQASQRRTVRGWIRRTAGRIWQPVRAAVLGPVVSAPGRATTTHSRVGRIATDDDQQMTTVHDRTARIEVSDQ